MGSLKRGGRKNRGNVGTSTSPSVLLILFEENRTRRENLKKGGGKIRQESGEGKRGLMDQALTSSAALLRVHRERKSEREGDLNNQGCGVAQNEKEGEGEESKEERGKKRENGGNIQDPLVVEQWENRKAKSWNGESTEEGNGGGGGSNKKIWALAPGTQ